MRYLLKKPIQGGKQVIQMANFVIVTNNPKVFKKYSVHYNVEFLDTDYMAVLNYVRDMIHKGHKILTHPLAGSIKPNETPFKSVFITKSPAQFDAQSLAIIESSIETCKKFSKLRFPDMSDTLREDFSDIDCSLVDNAFASAVQ